MIDWLQIVCNLTVMVITPYIDINYGTYKLLCVLCFVNIKLQC